MRHITILLLAFLALVNGQNTCDEYTCPFDNTKTADITSCTCRSGNSADCPSGYACCPDPVSNQGKCYDTRTHNCCQYTATNGNAAAATFRFWNQNGGAAQQCCAYGGVRAQTDNCVCRNTDDDCKTDAKYGNFYGNYKCCKTIADTLDTTNDNDANARKGVCFNPDNDFEKCCADRHWLKASNGVTPNKNSLVYNPLHSQCCSVEGVKDFGDGNCACNDNSECGNGGQCCYKDISLKNTHAASFPCTQHCSGDSDNNCLGQCVPKGMTCNDKGCGILGVHEECCTFEAVEGGAHGAVGYTKYVAYSIHSGNKCCHWNATKGETEGDYPALGNVGPQLETTRCPCKADGDCGGESVCCFSDGNDRIGYCTLEGESCCRRGTNSDNGEKIPDEYYDPETEFCCKINGKATNDIVDDYRSCLCAQDSDCDGTGGKCCISEKLVSEKDHLKYSCDATHPNACTGICINTEFQDCCGKHTEVCFSEYEKCCGEDTVDATCCNKYTETCREFYTKRNKYEDDEIESCSKREHWTPTIVYFAFVFPILLALISIGLFIVAVINALRSEGDKILTIVLIVVSIFALLVGILVLFSPVWKFALICLITNIIILNACQAGGVWSRRFAVILAIVCFLYIIDPFSGNALLSFHAWNRAADDADADADGNAAGLQWAVKALLYQPGANDGQGGQYNHNLCFQYYNFFQLDEGNHNDLRRFPADSHEDSWGFCKRGWLHAIGVMSGLLIIFEVLIVLIAIALIPRKAFVFDEKTGQIVPIQDPVGSA